MNGEKSKHRMNKKIYDISPAISPQMAVFPGDTAFSRKKLMSFDQGHHLELSTINSTVHLGAHADAPIHYHADGVGIGERNLNFYLGECQVIHCHKKQGERIYPDDIARYKIQAPRVLFRTGSFPNPNEWNNDFNSLSPELIELLSSKKVITIGIDTPSIDPADDEDMVTHKMIFDKNMAILEGIVLDEVPEGLYELIALPLKISGADASPVRAILREL